MNLRHLARMSRWARSPPSERRVVFVFGVIVLCLLIAGVEYFGWWPAWAKPEFIRFKP